MKKLFYWLVIIAVVLVILVVVLQQKRQQSNINPIVEDPFSLYLSAKDPLIVVPDFRQTSKSITSPLTITGKAIGNWFFGASFPVEIQDKDRKVLGTGIAQSQGEWMTTDFVPFVVTVSFNAEDQQNGFLVFKKDNPSGLKEHDDELRIPVVFSEETIKPCQAAGCGGQLCTDQTDAITTCEYREEWACLRLTRCERQSSGQCGWTKIKEYISCLEKLK
ncbi:MAG: Gmad2 immunoglobulin-like domain-containing protein [bacterium]